jgi:hypothetical protein
MKIFALAGNTEKPIRAGHKAGLLGRQAIHVGENDALHGPGSTGCLSGACLAADAVTARRWQICDIAQDVTLTILLTTVAKPHW